MPPALLRYLVVSYALAALLGGGAGLIGQGPGTLGFVALAALMMWTPTVGAWAAQRAKGEALVEPLGLRPVLNRWLLVAVLAPLGLALLTTAFQLLMPGVSFNPDPASILSRVSGVMTPDQLAEATATLNQLPIHPYWLSLLQAVGAGLTVNALFAFGEEIGWRGFMLKALDGRGFWSVSLLTGVAWGFWHAPVILQGYNYPQHPLLGVPLFAVFCVLLSPLHTLVRERGGSVWHAAVLHGTFNAAAGVPLLVVTGGDDLTTGAVGLPGMMSLVVANGLIWLWRRREARLDPQAQ
ncbi:MAG: CPBP family intramembrane metalloprotease [Deltaproteobacteria bacterium]|nr:CPBP family intramembrane metalloprotease [Deltaproteobacteria bacterium]